jgi:PHD/YefM family antitoxin component YafN of YafNO toxin-antitoxin module
MEKNICVERKELVVMAKLIEELQERLESLELASDPEFMESLRKSKEEINKGDVVNFDDL